MLLLHLGFKISFSISFLEIAFNENYVFRDLSRIALMLGWFLYFVIRFSNGSSELALFTDKSSYFGIFNLATILKKKLLKISEISLSLPMISSSSISVILSHRTLIREKGFNCFPKQFVIGDIPIIKIVIIIALRFTC